MKNETHSPLMWTKNSRIKFREFIEPAETVDLENLHKRVKRACALSITHEGDKIVAAGAVKYPYFSYLQRLSKLFDYNLEVIPFELGWVCVSPDARGKGLGDEIVKNCLNYIGGFGVYATVCTYNISMIHILEKNGFKKEGRIYSNDKNKLISLMIKKGDILKDLI